MPKRDGKGKFVGKTGEQALDEILKGEPDGLEDEMGERIADEDLVDIRNDPNMSWDAKRLKRVQADLDSQKRRFTTR